MPDSSGVPLGQIIGLGTEVGSQIFNAAQQNRANRFNANFSEYMYDKARADALTDQKMQNDYNSPAAQMARLKAAGLNPNLVAPGISSQAAPVRSTNFNPPKIDPARIDARGVEAGIMDIYDTKLKQAQTNNIEAARDVALKDAAVKAAQVDNINADTILKTGNANRNEILTAMDKLRLSQESTLNDVTLESRRQQLEKLKADTAFTLSQNERQNAITNANLAKTVEDILTQRANRETSAVTREKMQAEIANLKRTGTLQDMDIQLRKMGINPNDPAYMRILGKLVNSDAVGQTANAMKDALTKAAQGDDSWFSRIVRGVLKF